MLQQLLQSEENEMDYFVGLDVSLRSVAVCVIDAGGKHVFEGVVACEIDGIVACWMPARCSKSLIARCTDA